MPKKNDVWKWTLKPGVPGKEIDNIEKMIDNSNGFVTIKYSAREQRRASIYAAYPVNKPPQFAKTTATYTVIKEDKDYPAVEWDDNMKEWIFDAHPPEPTSS